MSDQRLRPVRGLGRSERKVFWRSLQLAHVDWRLEIPISLRYLVIVKADLEYIC